MLEKLLQVEEHVNRLVRAILVIVRAVAVHIRTSPCSDLGGACGPRELRERVKKCASSLTRWRVSNFFGRNGKVQSRKREDLKSESFDAIHKLIKPISYAYLLGITKIELG